MSRWLADETPPRVGVSACLLGREVRHDGGHKRDSFLVDVLGPHVEWVPVCPEVELGMGVPRPPIRIEERAGELRLLEPRSGADQTRAMTRFAARRVRELERLGLCGYVLKKDSPSCGLERVPVWRANGRATRTGRGLFAAALLERMPALPVEEEGRLADPAVRVSFVARIFAYRRLRALFGGRWTLGELAEFHSAHEPLLLAHDEAEAGALGRLVARARTYARAELRARYIARFMNTLARGLHRSRP
jgi:uncharacterized protein YbbK (DUF523 family)